MSPRGRIVPTAAEGGTAAEKRATSPTRIVWEGQEGSSRASRRAERMNGCTRTRGSVKAHTKDSSGNAVRYIKGSVASRLQLKLVASRSYDQGLWCMDMEGRVVIV